MIRFLRELPKQTALFAAMDGRARLVLDACAEAGIGVPEEMAVLGVDDDPIICESTASSSHFHSLSRRRHAVFRVVAIRQSPMASHHACRNSKPNRLPGDGRVRG